MPIFSVEDNPGAGRHTKEEIKIVRHSRNTTLVWKLSFEDLVDLQTTIATYIAGERA